MLIIDEKQLGEVYDHARLCYPEECCGLLIGRVTAVGRRVEQVRWVENAWDRAGAAELGEDWSRTRESRYFIDPQEMLAVMREGRSQNLEIVGVYHSHPDQEAVPSECDRRLAWEQYSYLIVAVRGGRGIGEMGEMGEMGEVSGWGSWELDGDRRFQSEPVQLIRSNGSILS
jgi:proteasome lid subunit RPN8/RPN11